MFAIKLYSKIYSGWKKNWVEMHWAGGDSGNVILFNFSY